ncbi:hypothetical protein SAMN02746089_01118 [Caldanaerobius fijiensis DSM 17918]|uniref:Uncharacterized protein n=1 Tax=Caldanaerobius fijiensis DSM 17918 TaxID=1121256 RepID=A0A1M4Y052_9THEO|nr:hypothetical protein [Caldanaerobius fijiensis]SHE99075.1 hypothetical protein SAMN02746089_01118 [Caldanaerobius fijiensis DSM 17918]
MNREAMLLLLLLLVVFKEKVGDSGTTRKTLPLMRGEKDRKDGKDEDIPKFKVPEIHLKEEHFYKLRDLMSSIKPYLPEYEQILSEIYVNSVNIYDCYKRLNNVNKSEALHQIKDVRKERKNKIEMLKAVKSHIAEDKQELFDFSLNLLEVLDGLMSNWNEYVDKIKAIMGDEHISQVDKMAKIIELFKPIFRDDEGKLDKLIKNIKIIDLVTKAESVINDKDNKGKGDKNNIMRSDSGDEKERFLNNVKTLMNDQQKEAFDKLLNYLRNQGEDRQDNNKEIEAQSIEIKENEKKTEKNEEKDLKS